jgi:hypothetical protein
MPGGFHPFHAGHFALYKSAKEAFPDADVYVAASDSRTERPFPFQIKQKLAQVAGVKPNEFVQVKSPFRSEEITAKYNPEEDVLIFVRSEKDKTEQPIPGGTKKDGTPAYFQRYNPKDLKPFKQHGYITYLPTVEFAGGIKSATEIRKQWPHLNARQKANMVQALYPNTTGNKKLIDNVVQLINAGMGELTEGEVINVDFSRGKKTTGGPDWKQLDPSILEAVNEWFWTEQEMTSFDAQAYKKYGQELRDHADEIKAILALNGYDIDLDDSGDNIILTYKNGGVYKLPTDNAYDFTGWAEGSKPVNEGDVVSFKRPQLQTIPKELEDAVSDWWQIKDTEDGKYMKASLAQRGIDVEHKDDNMIDDYVMVKWRDGNSRKKGIIKVDDIMEKLIKRAYQNPPDDNGPSVAEAFAWDKIEEDQYWNVGDGQDEPAAGTQPSEELRLKKSHQYAGAFVGESVDRIRKLIKETSDDEKEKTLHLHHKLFQLIEEEKNNVIDLNKARDEKAKSQEKLNDVYHQKRKQQEHMLDVIQQILIGLHQELDNMMQVDLAPIEFIDFQQEVTAMIDKIENFDANDFPFYDDSGELLEMYKRVKFIKEAWLNSKSHTFESFRNDPILAPMPGGDVDTSGPKVLRPQDYKTKRVGPQPNRFWKVTKKHDYLPEK